MKQKTQTYHNSESGTVLLEFVLTLPLMFICISLICQLSHIMLAKQVMCYAAYCAARSALVTPTGEEAEQAAREAASTVLGSLLTDESPIVSVTIEDAETGKGSNQQTGDVAVTLSYEFPLMIPMVGNMISYFSSGSHVSRRKRYTIDPVIGWTGPELQGAYRDFPDTSYSPPSMTMTESCIVVKPYSTKSYPTENSR